MTFIKKEDKGSLNDEKSVCRVEVIEVVFVSEANAKTSFTAKNANSQKCI